MVIIHSDGDHSDGDGDGGDHNDGDGEEDNLILQKDNLNCNNIT